MLRETLKREIDSLNESQLTRVAEVVAALKIQSQQLDRGVPFWKRATPEERAQDLRRWVAGLPKTEVSLPDEAFDRENIYE